MLLPLIGGCAKVDLSTLKVEAEASDALAVGEGAVWTITVANLGGAAIPVHDVDISQSLLAGVTLDEDRIEPRPQSARTVAPYRSFRIDQVLAPGQSLTIRLPVVARPPEADAGGEFAGDVDVCVDNFRQQTVQITYRVPTEATSTALRERPIDTPAAASAYVPQPADAVGSTDDGPEPPATDERDTEPTGQSEPDTEVGGGDAAPPGKPHEEPNTEAPTEPIPDEEPGPAGRPANVPSNSPAAPSAHGAGSQPGRRPPTAGHREPRR